MDFSTSNLKASNSYDEQLLSRVIHYHGFQLTVALQKSLDVDLGPFIREQILLKGKRKSVRGITGVEVSKNIQEFIANNAKVLYKTFPKRNQMQTDYVSPLPNLEMYVNKCPESRRRSFLKRVEEGDVVYGVITSKSGRHQLEVHVLCSEGKKYTNVSMLNVLGTVVVPEYAQSREPLYIDDLVRCGVHSKVKTTKPRICFYLAVENFQFANRLKKPTSPLGKIKFEELPPKFRARHTMDGSENLHEVVENYVNSPDCEASLIARKFGVEDKPLSLMPSLRQQPAAIGSALSQLQMDCWSSQVVKDGKNLVNKNPKIAMDCFDMALKFNPLNSEATYLKKMLRNYLR